MAATAVDAAVATTAERGQAITPEDRTRWAWTASQQDGRDGQQPELWAATVLRLMAALDATEAGVAEERAASHRRMLDICHRVGHSEMLDHGGLYAAEIIGAEIRARSIVAPATADAAQAAS